MSARPRDCYKTDEEFKVAVDQLNGLFDARWPFFLSRARSRNQDHFGDTIECGELYFKRTFGGAFDNIIQLSEASMERFCWCMLYDNPALRELAEEMRTDRAAARVETSEAARQILAKLRSEEAAAQ